MVCFLALRKDAQLARLREDNYNTVSSAKSSHNVNDASVFLLVAETRKRESGLQD